MSNKFYKRNMIFWCFWCTFQCFVLINLAEKGRNMAEKGHIGQDWEDVIVV